MSPALWDNGHAHGWLILKDDQQVARLDFLQIDQPFHLFHLTKLDSPTDLLRHIISLRAPDPSITFRNLGSGTIISDSEFTMGQRSDEIVALRDFRIPPSTTGILSKLSRVMRAILGR
jgi:hypothetical protein